MTDAQKEFLKEIHDKYYGAESEEESGESKKKRKRKPRKKKD